MPFNKKKEGVYKLPVKIVEPNTESHILEVTAEEARDAKVKTDPGRLPSKLEVDKHYSAAHLPFRSWCRLCARGKAVDDGHVTKPD